MIAQVRTDAVPFLKRVTDARARARELSRSIGLPSRREESWRKIDLDLFNPEAYSSTAVSSVGVEGAGIEFFRLNGGEPEMTFEPRAEFFRHGDLLPINADFFTVRNLANTQNLLYIRAKENGTVRIQHRQRERNAIVQNNVLIDVPSGIRLTVVEEFEGREGAGERFWNCETRVFCDQSAALNYIALYDFEKSDCHFHRFQSDQMRDTSVHVSIVHSGGLIGKTFYTARLREPGCHFRGIGVATGAGREFNDIEMSVEHLADHGESSLHYRTVLKGRAHSVFTGNLFIPEHIRDVRSRQLNNNLLIGERARAESIPRLIIKSEAVQADHGATVGEINAEALWYLMSRGIPEAEARTLLIEGFVSEMIEEIPLPELHERILENLIHRDLEI